MTPCYPERCYPQPHGFLDCNALKCMHKQNVCPPPPQPSCPDIYQPPPSKHILQEPDSSPQGGRARRVSVGTLLPTPPTHWRQRLKGAAKVCKLLAGIYNTSAGPGKSVQDRWLCHNAHGVV